VVRCLGGGGRTRLGGTPKCNHESHEKYRKEQSDESEDVTQRDSRGSKLRDRFGQDQGKIVHIASIADSFGKDRSKREQS
jgi:hypothetical protein